MLLINLPAKALPDNRYNLLKWNIFPVRRKHGTNHNKEVSCSKRIKKRAQIHRNTRCNRLFRGLSMKIFHINTIQKNRCKILIDADIIFPARFLQFCNRHIAMHHTHFTCQKHLTLYHNCFFRVIPLFMALLIILHITVFCIHRSLIGKFI